MKDRRKGNKRESKTPHSLREKKIQLHHISLGRNLLNYHSLESVFSFIFHKMYEIKIIVLS